MKRFKESFGIKSKSQLILVFIVFGITGTISAAISAPVMNLFGLSLESFPELFYWPVRLLIIFPIYQVLLIIIAYIFGQFNLFWNFEKKLLKKLGFGFLFKSGRYNKVNIEFFTWFAYFLPNIFSVLPQFS